MLLYKNADNFCILILFPGTLISLLIFFMDSFDISKYIIMSSLEIISLLLFLFEMHLILLSCLSTLLRTFRSVLKRSGEGVQPCLVLVFRGKGFSFSPSNIVLAMGLSYMTFTASVNIPSMLILLSLSHEGMLYSVVRKLWLIIAQKNRKKVTTFAPTQYLIKCLFFIN